MKNYRRRKQHFYWTPLSFLALVIPLVLMLLFFLLRKNTAIMMWWANGMMSMTIRLLSALSSIVNFSIGEVLIVATSVALVGWLLYRLYLFGCLGELFLTWQHLLNLATLFCWVGAWICWLWNPLYFIPSFAQRSGLDVSPYPVEDLQAVTTYFAYHSNQYAPLVERDEELHFAVDSSHYFNSALHLYDTLESKYPFLQTTNVKVKSFALSKFQSYFGFTGAYIPFTGEANINTHAPAVFHPVTIAHEMAHQRRIAPEQEANFLAITACLDSADPIFQYSGYLFGLIQLSNSFYPEKPNTWQSLMDDYFTDEIRTDWNDNYNYWRKMQTPVEDVAKEVYDGFLKSNQQSLGIKSYGACVDLLVSYYREDAYALLEELGIDLTPVEEEDDEEDGYLRFKDESDPEE